MTELDSREKPFSQAILDRRATPSFLPDPLPEADLEKILVAGLSAPSAYNLQPWRFVVVLDPEQRRRLRVAAMNQSKVEEAPVVIVACADLDSWKAGDLDEVIRIAQAHGYGDDARYASMRKNVTKFFTTKPGSSGAVAPDFVVWANRHTMIALTTMMWMAEVLGYDTAPMEGFDEGELKSVLGIPAQVRVVALLAIGHRQGMDKPFAGRFPISRTVFADRWGASIAF